jgi:hypothetical protein
MRKHAFKSFMRRLAGIAIGKTPRTGLFGPVTPSKNTEIFPLFKYDIGTLSFYASKDGKISVSFSSCDASKDQAFEVSWETYLGRSAGLGGGDHVEWGVRRPLCFTLT